MKKQVNTPLNKDNEGVNNFDYNGINVSVLSKLPQINGVVLQGSAFLNSEKNIFEFVQRHNWQKKNRILARSLHTTFRETKNGIRATIVFDKNDKRIKEELITELRECFKKMEGVK